MPNINVLSFMLMKDVLRKKPDFVNVKMRVIKIYSSLIYVYCCLRSFRSFDKSPEDVHVPYVDCLQQTSLSRG